MPQERKLTVVKSEPLTVVSSEPLPKPTTGTFLDIPEVGTGARELSLGALSTLPGGTEQRLPSGRELATIASSPLATAKELGSMGLETAGGLLSFLTSPGRDVAAEQKRSIEEGRMPPLSFEEGMFRAGQVGGAAVSAVLPGTKVGRGLISEAGSAPIKAVAKIGDVIAARPKVAFKEAMTKLPDRVFDALKPSKLTRMRVKDAMPDALQDVVALATEQGRKVESVADIADVMKDSKRLLNEDIQKLAPQGLSIDGDELAAEIAKVRKTFESKFIEKGTGKEVSELAPGISESAFSELEDAMSKFKGRMLTLDQAEEMRRGVNARLSAFMRKNQIKQGKEAASNPGTAIDLALRDALESGINKSLTKAGFQASSPFRKRYANIRTVEDAVVDRFLSELKGDEAMFFNFDSLDTITAGSGITALVYGEPAAAVGLGTTVAARHMISQIRKRLSDPDRLVKKAFDGVVGSEFAQKFKRASVPERKLLTGRTDIKGPLQMPGVPADAALGSETIVSSSPVVPGMQGIRSGKLLPEQAGAPFVTPETPIPDVVRQPQGFPVRETNRQLPPSRSLAISPSPGSFVDELPSTAEAGQVFIRKSDATAYFWDGRKWTPMMRWNGSKWIAP